MSEYDYIEGAKRIGRILDNPMHIEEKNKIPNEGSFTFENGYMVWVTAIFVDIRHSTELFSKKNERTAKLIRAFTSEIIEILKNDKNFTHGFMEEIGIRGDCVYAIYSTPCQEDIFICYNKTVYINTFINMLNKMLTQRGMQKFQAGIGMATDKELIIKAGRANSGINSKVWIGNAVTMASKLSALGDKDGNDRLFYSSLAYENFIKEQIKNNPSAKTWFDKSFNCDLGQNVYSENITIVGFSDFISQLR